MRLKYFLPKDKIVILVMYEGPRRAYRGEERSTLATIVHLYLKGHSLYTSFPCASPQRWLKYQYVSIVITTLCCYLLLVVRILIYVLCYGRRKCF